MAINWKRSSKEKETKGRGYLLTAGIVFVLMIASLILGGWLYQKNFQSSGILDMADHTYRNDANYANDVVESFHDWYKILFTARAIILKMAGMQKHFIKG